MAYSDIDKVNGHLIRKLHSKDKKKSFGYITLPVDYKGVDPQTFVHEFKTLTEARNFLGAPAAVSIPTKPKMSNPQNQKGYNPELHSKRG